MNEFKTVLQPADVKCPPELVPTNSFQRLLRQMLGPLSALALVAAITGCSTRWDDLSPNKDMVAVPIGVVGHYGAGINVPELSIDDTYVGMSNGWGGGVAGSCCVLVPRDITKPMTVTVKWRTSRTDVYERIDHEESVPIHFSVEPGKSSGLYVHLLPGHHVEVWTSWPWPTSPVYPGPAYPRDPAPVYVPLPGEQPWRGDTRNSTKNRPHAKRESVRQ